MLKFSKMFHGDFKRQIMKQPWTKKQKFRFWTKRPANKNNNNNNNNEKPLLDLALRAGKNGDHCALLLLRKNFCESFLMAILRRIFSFPEVKPTKSEHCQNPKPAR